MWLPEGENSLEDMFICFDRMYASVTDRRTDRQADRQTETARRHRSSLCKHRAVIITSKSSYRIVSYRIEAVVQQLIDTVTTTLDKTKTSQTETVRETDAETVGRTTDDDEPVSIDLNI